MARRTKIVATIGPASEDPQTLRRLVVAGMDMARISLAHGPLEEALRRIADVRDAARAEGRFVGVLADLPGPKVRSSTFVEGGVFLKEGDTVDLVEGDGRASDWRTIAVDHPDVLTALHAGDRVALGDGGTELLVEVVDADRAVALVLTGGRLQGRPGIALPEDRFAMDTPTAEDLRLLDAVVGAGVDAVALSFVRSAADVQRLRTSIASNDGPMVMAKIETRSAVDDIDAIVGVADAVMVARGDLGIRCALEDVPHFQKRIIRTGVAYGRPVVTATQMLESMIQAPTPTRAEVTDVANAVFDGTSALMLSAETAIGHDPVLAVTTMARITVRAEQEFDHRSWGASLGRQQQSVVSGSPPSVRITAAISAAAWRAAADADAVAIIACTNTGSTARAISRFRPPVPIFAVTPSESTARQLSVAWGITPLLGERRESSDDITWFAVMKAVETGLVEPDDIVAVLVGSPLEPDPVTDMLRLVRVRDL